MVSSVVLHLTRTMFNEGKIRCSDGVTQRALNFSTAVAAVTSLCMANHLHWLPRSFVAQVRRFDGVLYNPRLPPPLNYVTTLRRENYTIVMNLPLRVGKQLYSRLSTQRMYYEVYCLRMYCSLLFGIRIVSRRSIDKWLATHVISSQVFSHTLIGDRIFIWKTDRTE